MLAHLLKVLLICFQLLYLPTHRSSLNFFCGSFAVDLDLVFPFLLAFSGDIFQKMFGSHFEMVIHVNVFPIRMTYFAKSVHVELPHKGGKIAVFEINGQNFFRKPTDVFDIEGVLSGGPANNIFIIGVLNHLVELEDEEWD
jgi:hypothetical protein